MIFTPVIIAFGKTDATVIAEIVFVLIQGIIAGFAVAGIN
jgi:hypothetical protein